MGFVSCRKVAALGRTVQAQRRQKFKLSAACSIPGLSTDSGRGMTCVAEESFRNVCITKASDVAVADSVPSPADLLSSSVARATCYRRSSTDISVNVSPPHSPPPATACHRPALFSTLANQESINSCPLHISTRRIIQRQIKRRSPSEQYQHFPSVAAGPRRPLLQLERSIFW